MKHICLQTLLYFYDNISLYICNYMHLCTSYQKNVQTKTPFPRCFVAPSWCLDLDPNLPRFRPKLAMRPRPRFEEPEVHSGASYWPTWRQRHRPWWKFMEICIGFWRWRWLRSRSTPELLRAWDGLVGSVCSEKCFNKVWLRWVKTDPLELQNHGWTSIVGEVRLLKREDTQLYW